jgi:hypothetical protein
MKPNPPPAETRDGIALHARIMACPDCGDDLQDEAFAAWCPSCQMSVSFASVIASGGDDA